MQVAIRSTPFWLIVLVSACATIPPPASSSQASAPTDPVLAFVSSGGIGQTAAVNDPAEGGPVSVDIETQYNSASGQICRTYAVANSTGQVQQLACDDGANWRVVPPLINSSNQVASH